MNESAPWLGERLFLHVWEISLYGSGLLLLVLAIDLVWRDKVPLRFRQVLGILAAVRLLVPFTFTSPAGVFGANPVEAPIEVTDFQPSVSAPLTDWSSSSTSGLTDANVEAASTPLPSGRDIGVVDVVTGVWLTGLFGLVALTSIRYLRLRRGLRDGRSPDERLERLIEACAWEMGLRRPPSAMLTRFVSTPAVTGLFRAQLLLPENFEAELSEDEQRMVLLHELAHVRHRDLWVNWLIALVRAVHWFNPLVWLAFRRMRLHQELLCDRAVIARLGEPAAATYGAALVRVMERFVTPRAVPGLLPVVTNQNQLKERIVMLMKTRTPTRSVVVVALSFAAIAATVTFTKAQPASESKPEVNSSAGSDAEKASEKARVSRPDEVNQNKKLNELEVLLAREEKKLAELSDQLDASLGEPGPRLTEAQAKAAELTSALNQLNASLGSVKADNVDDLIVWLTMFHAAETRSLGLAELVSEKGKLRRKLAGLLTQYGRTYPAVRETEAELEHVESTMKELAANIMNALIARKERLTDQLVALDAEVQQRRDASRQYLRLKNRHDHQLEVVESIRLRLVDLEVEKAVDRVRANRDWYK